MFTVKPSNDEDQIQDNRGNCSNDSEASLRDPLDDQRQLVGGDIPHNKFTGRLHNHASSTNQNTSAYDPEFPTAEKTAFTADRSMEGLDERNITNNVSDQELTLFSIADSEMDDKAATVIRMQKSKGLCPSTTCEKILCAVAAILLFLFFIFFFLYIQQQSSPGLSTTIMHS